MYFAGLSLLLGYERREYTNHYCTKTDHAKCRQVECHAMHAKWAWHRSVTSSRSAHCAQSVEHMFYYWIMKGREVSLIDVEQVCIAFNCQRFEANWVVRHAEIIGLPLAAEIIGNRPSLASLFLARTINCTVTNLLLTFIGCITILFVAGGFNAVGLYTKPLIKN